MKKMEPKLLVEGILKEMEVLQLREQTIAYYKIGLSAICEFYEDQNQVFYSKEFLERFLDHMDEKRLLDEISLFQHKRLERASKVLIRYADLGELTWYTPRKGSSIKVNGYFSDISSSYEAFLGKNQISGIRYLNANVRHFLKFLEDTGHKNFTEMSLQTIKDFLIATQPTHRGSIPNVMYSVKSFVSFLNKQGIATLTPEMIPFKVAMPRKKVLPCFSSEEVKAILEQINTGTPQGKRDYAIIYLASRTGLRCSDILGLKLADINWKHNELHIIQKKTGQPLSLPFGADTGKAIADYILQGRPDTDEPYVFLRVEPPYRKLADTAVTSNILAKYMKKAGITHLPGDGKTFHALRRSMGTWMLESEIPLPTIAQVLGHRNLDSTKRYLSLATSMLSECALDIQYLGTKRRELA